MKKSTPYFQRSKWLLLLFLSLCGSLNAWCQPFNFKFRFVNLPENFSTQYITLLDRDAAGMLWFVTNNGLHRYDGSNVLTFDLQSKPSLPDLTIYSLFADSHNNLWLATAKGLVRFDLQKWTMTFAGLPSANGSSAQDRSITAVAEGRDGQVHFGSASGKVFSYNQDRIRFVTQVTAAENGNAATQPGIRSFREDGSGRLWCATSAGQLAGVSASQKTVYAIPEFQNTGIEFFSFDSQGRCLVYADDAGAVLFDTVSRKTQVVHPPAGMASLQKSKNFPVLLNSNEVAFFSLNYQTETNSFGLYNLQTDAFSSLDALYPASFKTSVFRKVSDKNGQVYISTDRGIAIVEPVNNPFQVALADLQNINSIRTIYRRESDRLYISSYKDGFTAFNQSSGTSTPLSSLLVSGILPWGKDSMLMGTESQFPLWYMPSLNRFMPVFSKLVLAAHHRLNQYIVCLRREADTLVWAGTYKGCYLFNPLNGRVVKEEWKGEALPLQESHVDDILKMGGYRFFATHEGIYRYHVKTERTIRLFTQTGNGMATTRFLCLQQVGGHIWAGSYGKGILVFDTAGRILKQITSQDGLTSNIVFSLPISGGHVLAGTSKGLSLIDIRKGVVASYSSQHYFPSNEFNRAAWLVLGDTVYMGTTNGMIRFTASSLLKNKALLQLQFKLSGFRVTNDDETKEDYSFAYASQPALTISPGTKSFSLTFGALEEAASDVALLYRFKGDSTWQSIGSKREITFVSLPPGRYTIQVNGMLPGGQLLQNLFSIPVTVQPLFYQTVLFKVLLVLTGLVLIALAVKRRERLLRKEQQLRSRIASDLHDEVGSALTRIYFQAEALTGAPVNDKAGTALKKIAASSQDALSSMNDMVWSINAQYDNASDMIDRMKDYIARLQEELEWRFSFDVAGSYAKKPLGQISRQNIFLIFKEGMNNAVKHGVENSVRLRVVFEDKLFCLTIENEVATPAAAIKKGQGGHGLQSMELRAEKINGDLVVNKNADGYFSIRLIVPI